MNNDLLYTNRFYAKENLDKKDINKRTKNKKDYTEFLKSTQNNTNKFLKKNILTNDLLPVTNSLNNQFPSNLNKNSYPILSDTFQDMSEDKYYKIRKSSISIYSGDRNKADSVMPNNYYINLSRKFSNIQKIVLKDISISNSVQTISYNNNNLFWQYPTKNELILSGSDNQMIPSKNNDIYFSEFPNSVNNVPSDQLIYGYQFPTSFVAVDDFKSFIKKNINSNVFHGKRSIFDLDIIELQDNSKNTSEPWKPFTNLNRKYEFPFYKNNTISEENMLINVDINLNNHIVHIINRIEEVSILSVQTFYSETSNQDDYDFGSYAPSPIQTLSNNKIYITCLKNSNLGSIKTSDVSIFPLVITNMENIGGIDNIILNNTCFFNENIYIDKHGVVPAYVSTYRKFDEITIPVTVGDLTLIRYELTLSTGNSGLYFNSSGFTVGTVKSETIIYNQSLQTILKGTTINNIFFTLEENNAINNNKYPVIGRALPFKFYRKLTGKANENCEVKTRSILNLLSFNNFRDSDYTGTISFSQEYKFIHRNTDQILASVITTPDQNVIINNMLKINYPQFRLNIENYNNKYYFRSVPFLFLKILPSSTENVINNSLIRVTNSKDVNVTQTYKKEFYFNIDKNISGEQEYKKETNNLFAKIYLKQVPYQTIIDKHGIYEYKFEDMPLENLDQLQIQFTDPLGEIVDLYIPHSFTLEIYEKISVLKDTLINSRRGEIVTNGITNIYN
jgi:hypothetical protein